MTDAPLLRRIVPNWAKRQHETWSTGRFVQRLEAASHTYVEQYGLHVGRGPFAGLKYPPELATGSGDLVAKLTGTYELELQGVISEWITRAWPRVINVGAAEGFYAVGLARSIPTAEVIAYDLDDDARARCLALAMANDVAQRVVLDRECTTAGLGALPPKPTALLCDCEGCEKHLLDPALAPMLQTCEILVELHDFLDPDISKVIVQRFEATHTIRMIEGRSRAHVVPPELTHMSQRERLTLIGERRPSAMRWARLEPRDRQAE